MERGRLRRPGCQDAGNALIRADKRDSLRATVLAWMTPLPFARCISGWATCSADCAAALSPLAIASSTFFTKVRIRAFRAWLRAVRVVVCRMRFRADAVFAILVRSLKLPSKRVVHNALGTGKSSGNRLRRGKG